MKNWINASVLAIVSLAWPLQSTAEDIDLFLGPIPVTSDSAPNVLFIIDNTGNWTAPFDEEKRALVEVFNAIKARVTAETNPLGINVGIMMFAESGSPNDGVGSGGYVRAAIRPMGEKNGDDKTYAELYGELIAGFHERDDKGNAGAGGLALAEAYHYFAGLAPYAGNFKAKTDFTGNDYLNSNASCCVESHPVWGLPDNALESFADTSYNSPLAGSCGKNYIIYISNGATQDPNSSSVRAYTLLEAAAGREVASVGLNPIGSQGNWADEWAHFMKDETPEAITTFTIDVLPENNNKGRGWTSLLKSMARDDENDTNPDRYYLIDDADTIAQDLVAAIDNITGKILAVNTVFASVALPAASNAQSTFLNQVFIGQFRPDGDALPRWPGNMKQYQIGYDIYGENLKMRDANSDPIVHSETGFIANCAASFWSNPDLFWSGDLDLDMDPLQVCTEIADSEYSNSPDGPIVEKGGQAQALRGIALAANRTVYTCDSTFADCNALTSFSTANADITFGLLNVDSSERSNTINWARGADIANEDGDGATNDTRASMHGDVVHSRPVALNYNTINEPQVVVYYSGNDGMLRAINGNRPDIDDRVDPDNGSIEPGEEIWSFMPPEFYPHITKLRDNTSQLKVPASGTSAPATGIAKPYGIDGPITAFEGDMPGVGTDQKYLFAGMRRAGRAVYAFDVTSITSPQLLWKKGCPNIANDAGCTADWSGIGQTWSQPNLMYALGYPDTGDMRPMLIMGGGYDACEDTDDNDTVNNSCSTGTKGNLIYILDAYDGTIRATLPTERGVSGAVTVVPYGEALDSGIKFAYAADLGGNIYRISGGTQDVPDEIGTTAPADWIITKIASLGCSTDSGGCDGNRKFLFGPDVVRIPNGIDEFAVLVGSGDREKPLTSYGAAADVVNYFFTVFDHPTDPDWLDDADNVCDSDIVCLDTLTPVTVSGVADNVTLSPKGWRLELDPGEQVVTGALTVFNVANFNTHIPAQPDDACAAGLGTATSYNLNYKTGEGRKREIIGGGLSPTPVGGRVLINSSVYERDADGNIVFDDLGNPVVATDDNGDPIITTTGVPVTISTGDSPVEVQAAGAGAIWDQPKSRVYWNIQQ